MNHLTYDKVENIAMAYDDLHMTYEGNMLTSVRDNASRLPYSGATDFDGMPGENPLTYNGSGSLVSDAGHGIARIDYDRLNNPVRIQFTDGSVTRYIYSAASEKLRVIHQTAVPNISVAIGSTRELAPSEVLSADSTDYLLGGSLTLRNGRIDKLQFEEGYCQASAYGGNATQDDFSFHYYDRDHLGNIRQVVRADRTTNGTLVQTMDYYPFGAQFCDRVTDSNVQSRRYNFSIEREKRKLSCSSEREKNRPKVNGKELDKMHGLDTYDYGARQYDPVLGRWDRMDPLCEKYYGMSPYAYCGGNPVKYVDPDGRFYISREQAKQYPRLNQYLQKGIQGILNNPAIMKALCIAGRFTNEQIKEMVKYGKGPTINVTQLEKGYYGLFNPGINSTTLNISEDIVNELEHAEGFDAVVSLFLVGVTILHEFSHYGDDLAGNLERDREDGKVYEENAYGIVIDKSNVKDYLLDYYNKKRNINDNKKEKERDEDEQDNN